MTEPELMKVVLVEPHEKPRVIEIENSLEAEQTVVGGLIEVSYFEEDENCVLISNEEAKLIGMEGNRRTDAGIIAGPFFICGTTEDRFRGLTDDEIQKYLEKFDQPEDISTDEVEADISVGFQIIF